MIIMFESDNPFDEIFEHPKEKEEPACNTCINFKRGRAFSCKLKNIAVPYYGYCNKYKEYTGKRLVDISVLKKQDFQDFSPDDVLYAIDNTPNVDAVEVVRCKDCKYWEDNKYCATRVIDNETEPNDYCSWGQKREDKE